MAWQNLLGQEVSAQALPTDEPFRFEYWRLEHGLPQITVNALAQDAQGFLWVGTEEGLARFDGLHFEVYDRANTPELGSNAIRILLLDSRGDLWIGCRRGLTRYRNGDFQSMDETHGLSGEIQTFHEDSDGSLWIGTSNGLARFVDGSFRTVLLDPSLANPSVRAIHGDQNGDLWVGTDSGLLQIRNPQNGNGNGSGAGTVFDKSHGLPHNQIRDILQDRSDRLWIATAGGWVRHIPKETAHPDGQVFVALDDPRHRLAVNAFFEDREGRLWVGSEAGLLRIEGETLIAYSDFEANRVETGIRAFWQDHEGNLWIGTGILGLSALRRQSVTVFDRTQGLADNLAWSVLEDPAGSIWIGSNRGLTRINAEGDVRLWTEEHGLPGEDVRAIATSRTGELWLGTDSGGLARLVDDQLMIERPGDLGNPPISSLLEDPEGRLWIGTTEGLFQLDGDKFQRLTTDHGLPHNRIWALHLGPEGQLWIGTDAGLAVLRNGRLVPNPEPFLQHDVVKALHHDAQGTLWIGTADGGLVRRPADPQEKTVRVTVADGLIDSLIHQILEDEFGWLWLSSNRGVFRILKKELDDFATGRVPRIRPVPFTETDGMGSRECNGMGHPAGFATRDGRIWFPTIRGVSIFNPKQLATRWVPVPAFIDHLDVDRLPLEGLPLAKSGPPKLMKVRPGIREIEIHFRALSFVDAERIGYRYWLEGFDPGWIDAGRARSAKYTNLPPGRYRFHVAATNPGGVWTQSGDTLELHLEPTLFQSWIFYLACALATIGAGLGLYRLRLRSVLQRDRLRITESKNQEIEQLTYNVCHDLKSPVLTIQGFVNLLEEDLLERDEEAVSQDLKRIRNATDQISGLLDELLAFSQTGRVALRSDPLDLGLLAEEAADLVAGQVLERGVEIEIQSDLPAIVGDRSHLLRLFQNLFDNAVKFMGDQTAPKIEVGGELRGDEVMCWVRDNGIGIEKENQTHVFELFNRVHEHADGSGIGLAMVSRIAKAHGGRIWVESEGRGKGSTFFFTLPCLSGSLD